MHCPPSLQFGDFHVAFIVREIQEDFLRKRIISFHGFWNPTNQPVIRQIADPMVVRNWNLSGSAGRGITRQ